MDSRTEPSRVRLVRALALSTLLFFGGGGMALLILVQGRDPLHALFGDGDILLDIVLGLASGLLIAVVAWGIISTRMMQGVREHYCRMIGPLIGSRWQRIWISICAGVGEEIFFRGALQHWLGIPITAILFVAIHGYLDPRDLRISTYGIFMTLGMLLLGVMAERYGLLGPMIAHTIIDIVLLERLHAAWRSLPRDQS